MKHNRILWLVVIIVAIMTVATSLKTSYSQQNQQQSPVKSNPTPTNTPRKDRDDASHFPVVDYDTPELTNPAEREKRIAKGKRYDNAGLVSKNPPSEDSGTTLFDEKPPLPLIPANESGIVVIGEVLNGEAHLSNDKGNVYSEFIVRVQEILKNKNTDKLIQDCSITIDRMGGWVQYLNGKKELYRVATEELPHIEKRYIFFLVKPDKSPNYNILTAYELEGGKIYPLDSHPKYDKFMRMEEATFLTSVREAITKSSPKAINQ